MHRCRTAVCVRLEWACPGSAACYTSIGGKAVGRPCGVDLRWAAREPLVRSIASDGVEPIQRKPAQVLRAPSARDCLGLQESGAGKVMGRRSTAVASGRDPTREAARQRQPMTENDINCTAVALTSAAQGGTDGLNRLAASGFRRGSAPAAFAAATSQVDGTRCQASQRAHGRAANLTARRSCSGDARGGAPAHLCARRRGDITANCRPLWQSRRWRSPHLSLPQVRRIPQLHQ